MIYLICQDWANTSSNHAGMKYLCKELEKRYPTEFKCIIMPHNLRRKEGKTIFDKLFPLLLSIMNQRNYFNRICKYLSRQCVDNDVVVLMEYLDNSFNTLRLVKGLKKNNPGIIVAGMAHLVPAKLDMMFRDNSSLHKWTDPIDCIFTLGSSLTSYLIKRGVDKAKVYTTFHYVDDYYNKADQIKHSPNVTVIAMGNQMRNIALLKKVVDKNPSTQFLICQGLSDLQSVFEKANNVTLIPFVSEEELRSLMNNADVSLNIMDDTIGSNVIVTSMAMGLAMICTDVGSIRDYCSDDNTFFCTTEKDYSLAIEKFTKDIDFLYKCKKHSMVKAKHLSLECFKKDFLNHLLLIRK